ncbi:A disintegrin and metalloproteinase with thrombospondin motifs 14 [Mactra antiquata]
MGFITIVSLCLTILVGLEENQVDGFRVTRQGNGLVIELLIVVDYSAFNKWYKATSTSLSHSQRVQEGKDNVIQYVSALIHSSNNVYRSLQSHNLNVRIKLVDVMVMTTPSQSPWTETVKVQDADGVNYDVDPTRVLPLFQPKSVELQRTVPHDHAMIFTKYSLYQGSGGTFSGYAYTEAECKQKSVSIVEDNEDLYTAQLIAHEIGHSLGCDHDGHGNAQSCPSGAGYAMEANFILANDKKWIFSTCSVDAIRNYIQYLNTHHRNCLTHIDNTHPDAQVTTAAHEWFGQVYTWDEQCKIHYGSQSYFCKDQNNGDLTKACLKMFCYNPTKRACYYIDGGDGTPCATGKWCMSNHCVTSTATNTQTGQTTSSPTSAPGTHSTSSSTDIDGQCVRKHGSGSYLCRGATAYDGKPYSDVICSDVQCNDVTRENWCLSSVADDHTSCGYKKWCVNGACVHDNSAPAVPDNCPWGDQKGVASYGLTCDEIRQPEHHWRCYDTFTSKVCCAACNSVLRNVTGCHFGDKSDWCQTNIASSGDRQMCYWGHNSDLCCEACNNYMNKDHVGCEFGDRTYSCHKTRCSSYDAAKLKQCCETCRAVNIIG